jgi:Leucine-rich repeat (LRR) protein
MNLDINFKPSTEIFSGIGETFINLKSLWIRSQTIKFVERSDFVGLTQLEDLILNGNQIEFLPEDVFWDLPNLKLLKLSGNKIKKLPKNIFKNLKKLKEINLSDNKIDYLPKNLFMETKKIERFYAYDNPLKVIDVDFTKFFYLSYLNLRNARCVNYIAYDPNFIQEAQLIINENCIKTTQN